MKTIKFVKPWNSMFKAFLYFCALSLSLTIFSQNKIEEFISADQISKVLIDGNQIFNIDVITENTNKISIYSLTDGEYQNEYKIHSEINNEQLLINLQKSPLNTIPDDKRNAHMVVAATLRIVMPPGLNVSIRSDIGSVKAEGEFKDMTIQLFQGSCTVNGSAELAIINTFDGDIIVTTDKATIEAYSNNGVINIPEESFKKSHWILKSIDGDITVVKPN